MPRYLRHAPTGRWLPVELRSGDATPATAYLAEFAARYSVSASDLVVVERPDRPADLDTNGVAPPARPADAETADQRQARASVAVLLDLLNIERTQHGRPAITPLQFATLVRNQA